MLVITVDLIPGGVEPLRRSIGTVQISNISDLADISSYHLLAMEAANPLTGTAARTGECILFGHDRRQSVWKLIEAAAAAIETADWEPL
ncbi:hypothetical protein [Bradyrhizobium sp. 62]|uniref:hypothetical protein n=1 Tax=Bradyrhizobium sp. 62 TaxID=1043588 RepID=UPI001FF9A440|nr:hypothetical protein [Bradyrhizobium sp. 62]MCK1365177.1 hypothetical protein [Bradyrhizobium sp. 62]